MLEQADEVYVSLCTDQLDDPERGMGLFSLVRHTGNTLIRMAKERGVRVAAPEVLEPGKRFRAKGLFCFGGRLFSDGPRRPAACAGSGPLRSEGPIRRGRDRCGCNPASGDGKWLPLPGFCRDRPHAGPIPGILDVALEHRDIPYFMDKPQAVDAEPLMRLVLSAFQVVRSGFASGDVFAYLKTGLAGFSTDRYSALENYTYLWNLSARKWKEAWADHPRGFVEEWTERDREQLEALNESRSAVVEPLSRFAQRVAEADGEEMALAVYRLLEDVQAAEHLKELAARLAADGRPSWRNGSCACGMC